MAGRMSISFHPPPRLTHLKCQCRFPSVGVAMERVPNRVPACYNGPLFRRLWAALWRMTRGPSHAHPTRNRAPRALSGSRPDGLPAPCQLLRLLRDRADRIAPGSGRQLPADGSGGPVGRGGEGQCRFHRPARYDNVLRLRTTIVRSRGPRSNTNTNSSAAPSDWPPPT